MTDIIGASQPDPDSAPGVLKAHLAAGIVTAISNQRLTVRAAASHVGLDPSDVQRIRNDDLARFSVDRLVRVAGRLGLGVTLTITGPGLRS